MRNRSTKPLSKAKVRQSWSKYNLYNLSRITSPPYKTKTFFQQKWSAKSMLRAYHGEQVREGQWERMFSRKLRSVVPMNPEYLARNDGSMESAGRGSGLEKEKPPARAPAIPYMQMTFAPLERRLDTAIFRALFASSARQARQFVVHGAVKVNGKKMTHPGYLLNPGDMFQVDPERVMFATGMPKPGTPKPGTATAEKPAEDDGESSEGIIEAAAADGEEDKDAGQKQTAQAETVQVAEEEEEEDPRQILKNLLAQSKSILASPSEKLAAKQKQDLRAFQKSVKRTLSKSKSTTILTDSLEAQFLELQNQLNISRKEPSLPSEQDPASTVPETDSITNSARPGHTEAFDGIDGGDEDGVSDAESTTKRNKQAATGNLLSQSSSDTIDTTRLSDQDIKDLRAALELLRDNPIDPSKPYQTPWQPREYMSAFAFIPRYLEVNQNICAAVYLRHPVARPGLAEVPSPFAEGTNGSAFAWYLRRR